TPGFSYFVIGQTSQPSAVAEEAGAEEVEAPPAVTEEEAAPPAAEEEAEAPAVESGAQGSILWIVPVLAVIVLAVVLYWYWKRR
ncbi:MAG: hypothetical protein AABX37_04140, partial [Nanoarchaeota archaeon]